MHYKKTMYTTGKNLSIYPRISRAPCPNRGKNALQYQTNANNLKKLMHISGNFESALSKSREKSSSVPNKRKQPVVIKINDNQNVVSLRYIRPTGKSWFLHS